VWEHYGIAGKGILVANIDTGVNKDHEALRDNFAAGRFDAVHGWNKEPYDDDGHGTHRMGTMCGRTRGIGVAPNATWIACSALGKYVRGREQYALKCAQWILQQNPLPNIVLNSWSDRRKPTSGWFDDVIAHWRAVGISPVFAIGNLGSECGTTNYPGNQHSVIGVGNIRI